MDLRKNKLIVALDVDTAARSLELVDALRDSVGMFKVGMQLFTAAGPDLVRRIVAGGSRVFLDLKYHDIPNTVAQAGIEATRLGVSIFNVHAAGGREMMKRTAEAVSETAARENLPRPRVIAVTLLTSVDEEILREIGITATAPEIVGSFALLSQRSGLDGVVASAREIKTIRETIRTSDFLIVTPGIRGAGAALDDQRRTMSAAEAIRSGADYVVVGRPILSAADPVTAARQIVEEIDEADSQPGRTGEFAEQNRAQSVH